MNAQTVVDTFAPFVGTEGLRDISRLELSLKDDRQVYFEVSGFGGWFLHPHIAHGFLLSRLAEGLTRRCAHPTRASAQDKGEFFCTNIDDGNDYFPDYPSAILAAARVEWPKREEKEQPTLPPTININGVVYRREAPHE